VADNVQIRSVLMQFPPRAQSPTRSSCDNFWFQ
jgi:hypothetical protein